MLTSAQFLKQGIQIGPWKVTRKVLLFIIAFCVVVLAFGTLMLETHAFESDWDDDDSNERYDDYDDDDDDWSFSGGDMVMMVLMGLSGIGILVSVLACCFAQVNPPSHLDQRSGGQVFTIQLTKPSIGPQHSLNSQYYQYHQQQHQQHEQQHQQQMLEVQRQRAQERSARQQQASAPVACSPPPPYFPPGGVAPSPSTAGATASPPANEKPPPYSP